MKKLLTLTAGLIFCAAVAHANGINLNLGDCVALGASNTMTTTCTANTTAPFKLVSTVELTQDIPNFNAAAVIIDFTASGTALPAWWNVQPGGCRAGHAAPAWNGTSGGTCHTVWDIFAAATGFSPLVADQWQLGLHGANSIRYNGGAAIGTPDTQPALDAAYGIYEWGICLITVDYTKTTSLGACAGCATPVCVVLNEVDLQQSGNPNPIVNTTPGSGFNWVNLNSFTGTQICPAATPTRNQTWGSLKSLYR